MRKVERNMDCYWNVIRFCESLRFYDSNRCPTLIRCGFCDQTVERIDCTWWQRTNLEDIMIRSSYSGCNPNSRRTMIFKWLGPPFRFNMLYCYCYDLHISDTMIKNLVWCNCFSFYMRPNAPIYHLFNLTQIQMCSFVHGNTVVISVNWNTKPIRRTKRIPLYNVMLAKTTYSC
jgi:hypothetical protein